MINKLFHHIRTEGVEHTLKKGRERVYKYLGMKTSNTIFYIVEFQSKIVKDQIQSDVVIERHYSENETKLLDIGFFKYERPTQWFNNGSVIVIAKYNGILVARAWIHFKDMHEIVGLGYFMMDRHECWLGPAFVEKKFRNQGIHKILLRERIEIAKEIECQTAYTCTNLDNIVSSYSGKNYGYIPIGEVEVRRTLGVRRKVTVKDYNGYHILNNRFLTQ